MGIDRIKVSAFEETSRMATTVDTRTELNELISRKGVHRNLHAGALVEHAIRTGEGRMASNGAIVAYTGKHTGRSPNDKFVVRDATTEDKVAWGSVNQPFDPEKFDALFGRVTEYLRGREIFVQDLFGGADPNYRLPIRVINEFAWHNLFVRQLFVRPVQDELKTHVPEFTVVAAPGFKADPQRDGTRTEAFVILNFSRACAPAARWIGRRRRRARAAIPTRRPCSSRSSSTSHRRSSTSRQRPVRPSSGSSSRAST